MKKNFFPKPKYIEPRYNSAPLQRIEEEIRKYSDPNNPKAIALVSKIDIKDGKLQSLVQSNHLQTTLLGKDLIVKMPYNEMDQIDLILADSLGGVKLVTEINMNEDHCSIKVVINIDNQCIWTFVFIPVK